MCSAVLLRARTHASSKSVFRHIEGLIMSRRKHEEEHENHERWLVSYGDFITLLFAFFVVMYAISSINTGKYRVLSDSRGSAFGRDAPQIPPSRAQIELGLNGLKPLAVLRREAAMRHEHEQLAAVSH